MLRQTGPKVFARALLARRNAAVRKIRVDGARVRRYTLGAMQPRYDWTAAEIRAIHDAPLFQLIDRGRTVLLQTQPRNEVQLCALLSVKTGGCPEDCGYCAQSAKHRVVKPEPMLTVEEVVARAQVARQRGSTRFCMGTAWRGARDGAAFERVLEMIAAVKALGLETCVTLGLVDHAHALRLKQAGLDTYNHNLDTSREFFTSVSKTRSFDDRLQTIRNIRAAGIGVCCGGIIGMGESVADRCSMLAELAALKPHPDSVPINALVAIPGTPLEAMPPVDPLDLVRMIATARIVLPRSRVRLSAGRSRLNREAQLLCLYAGANSIFYGEKLLTAANTGPNDDDELLAAAGLHPQRPFS